jgi:hypothetical protein
MPKYHSNSENQASARERDDCFFVVEHVATADMTDGQSLPPFIIDNVVWCRVRRLPNGNTLWRRIFLSPSSGTDWRTAPEDQSRAP